MCYLWFLRASNSVYRFGNAPQFQFGAGTDDRTERDDLNADQDAHPLSVGSYRWEVQDEVIFVDTATDQLSASGVAQGYSRR